MDTALDTYESDKEQEELTGTAGPSMPSGSLPASKDASDLDSNAGPKATAPSTAGEMHSAAARPRVVISRCLRNSTAFRRSRAACYKQEKRYLPSELLKFLEEGVLPQETLRRRAGRRGCGHVLQDLQQCF